MSYKALESTVQNVVEAMLPRFSHRELGLLLKFDVEAEYVGKIYNNRPQPKVRWKLWFLFNRPNNGTNVFVKQFNEHEINNRKYFEFPITMSLTSTHDSCWRSDGLRDIWNLYSSTAKYFERVLSKDIVPIRDINFEWRFNFISNGIKFVKFQPVERFNYELKTYTFNEFKQVTMKDNPELFERSY